MKGAGLLARALQDAGVTHVFSVSGNHVMCVYDALLDTDIRLIHTRHEAAAVHMADAWAQITGGVGVALVTGGPGHANAVSALYTAYMSESPVILLSGHAPLNLSGWGAFQEMDQVAMARPVAKQAWAISDPRDVATDLARACRIARSGRPGPVHLSLPTDILEAWADGAALPAPSDYEPESLCLDAEAGQKVVQALLNARRPIILAGPAACRSGKGESLAALEAALQIPIIATESPRGLNDPALGSVATVLAEADLILLLGKRLDFTLDFGQEPGFSAECRFLQIDPDAAELERSRRAVGHRLMLGAIADLDQSLQALQQQAGHAADLRPDAPNHHRSSARESWLGRVRDAVSYRPAEWKTVPGDTPEGLHPAALCSAVQSMLDAHPDSVLVVDGGEFGQWAQACLTAPYRLINGSAGAIGAGLPMAVAARLARPEALVVALMGDGSFGFHCAEFDTALRADAPFLCIVGNDACWNAEYQIQLRAYGTGRAKGCELLPTTYDRVARGFGAHGAAVHALSDLPGALESAASSNLPACINVTLHGMPAPKIRQPE